MKTGIKRTPQEYRKAWHQERPDVPYGTCWCSCRQKTKLPRSTNKSLAYVKGEPMRYVYGHKHNYRFQTLFPGDEVGPGPWYILEYLRGPRHAHVRALCGFCGNEVTVRVDHLRGPNATKSCGCEKRKQRIASNKARATHGHAVNAQHSASYRSWTNMNSRCRYEYDRAWRHYGGRGIEVCERWRFGTPDAFTHFLEDMGTRPVDEHGKLMVIDRIDNDGNYEPSNCRWTTQKANIANRRNNGNYGGARKRKKKALNQASPLK